MQDADGSARGRLRLEAAYDGEGHRWLRRMWSEGGKALVSFRDATGKVTADFEEASASGGLKHVKDYVHVGSQLVAINSFCGPRPDLTLDSPTEQNGELRLFRTDYVPSQDGFKVLIRGASGQQKVLSRDTSLATHFTIPLSELYPSETNLISIQTDASCGMTGYSNAISYTYYPPQSPPDPPSCIGSMGVSRSGFTGGSSTSLSLSATTTCTQGTRFNVYFLRDTGGPTIRLNGATLPASQLTLPNQPAGTGFGSYWFAPVNPATGIEGTAGPGSPFGIQNEDPDTTVGGGGGGGGTTNPPAVNAQYVHWDHLGSTRAISDEQGVLVASYKYYPFGMLADVSGGNDNRMMFTGHERDGGLNLDYMLARSYCLPLARFVSVDPAFDVQFSDPRSWNKYSYARNSPIRGTDPDGRTYEDQQGKQLEQQVQGDASRTQAEKSTVADVAANGTKVGTNVSPDAAIRVAAPGNTVGVDTLKPGEMLVTGPPASIETMGNAKSAAGQDVRLTEGLTDPGKVTIGALVPAAQITVFEGSLGLLGPSASQGRTVQQMIVDTFVHESGHLRGGVYNPEGVVQRALQGTPSQ